MSRREDVVHQIKKREEWVAELEKELRNCTSEVAYRSAQSRAQQYNTELSRLRAQLRSMK